MSRQIGLRDIYIAKLTKDDATGVVYDTPTKLERSITAKISPNTSSEKIYSDDSVETVLNTFDSIDVEIELNQLSLESRALLQGAKVVKGTLLENATDVAPTIALAFRSMKSDKTNFRHVWLYKGSFEITEDEYSTLEDKADAKSSKLKGTFYARDYDNAFRLMLDTDADSVDATTLANWFTEVQEQPTEA